MSNYNLLLASEEMTVMDEYTPEIQNRIYYQSEADLEKDMIQRLQIQGYEYLNIHKIDDAIANLRVCMEELNNVKFTDAEWHRICLDNILKKGTGIKDKTKLIQCTQDDGSSFSFVHDDGRVTNIKLIDKYNIYRNKLQVINQYQGNGNFNNRYDVTILINGLPLVHCELKKRGIAIKEAFNQIERYQRDSFWADNGLFEYVQIFIISNGTHTKYYSNTTRFNHVENYNGRRRAVKTGSNSFEFTSFWADAENKTILDLVDFTKTFLANGTLLKIITRYCVFTADENLLVMRPYQIAAVERILNQIQIANNYNRFGTIDAGGFIWHTTGSGKTLTSFKAAQLATKLDYIDKVLFVVDRNDLDYQTMKEYDRFQKNAANGNKSTKILEQQISNPACKIIVTTIQKLDIFVKRNQIHEIYNKNVVLIFDECHRSHFGDSHNRITKAFKKYAIFGFTGTPIFAVNSRSNRKHPTLRTTEQAFGKKLHIYTVVNAINDKNVLPFRIDYYNTIKANNADDSLIEDIDDEKILLAESRVSKVVHYILTHFDQKTMRNSSAYKFNAITNIKDVTKGHKEKRESINRKGFNSIFAVSSINAAKVWYEEFKRQMSIDPKLNRKIALIYSCGINKEEDIDGNYLIDEDSDSTDALSIDDRLYLEKAIQDYNKMFGTSFDVSNARFSNYYKDLSLRMKNGEIDILIVVNMFLTGFDATILNTLWVDKHLRQHGLIQAFSRTNRILNSVKAYGNIVCFRNLRKEVDDAISLFGDETASGIVLLKSYKDYYNGYDDKSDDGKIENHHLGYKENVEKLKTEYSLPVNMISEERKKDFIILFGAILRLYNILKSFDEFSGNEIFTEAEMQDYLAIYTDLHEEFKIITAKENVASDIVFEMDLVRNIVVNIDYVLALVAKYQKERHKNKKIPVDIFRAINSNLELRPKKELIEMFIKQLDDTEDTYEAWIKFRDEQKAKELAQIVARENLKMPETKDLIYMAIKNGHFNITDAEIAEILPPISRFGGGIDKRLAKKRYIYELLNHFFIKYHD